MGNEYKVRSISSPNETITLTDTDVIYSSKILGAGSRATVAIADASVRIGTSYGGYVAIAEKGTEAFRIEKVANAKGFEKEFLTRKDGVRTNLQAQNASQQHDVTTSSSQQGASTSSALKKRWEIPAGSPLQKLPENFVPLKKEDEALVRSENAKISEMLEPAYSQAARDWTQYVPGFGLFNTNRIYERPVVHHTRESIERVQEYAPGKAIGIAHDLPRKETQISLYNLTRNKGTVLRDHASTDEIWGDQARVKDIIDKYKLEIAKDKWIRRIVATPLVALFAAAAINFVVGSEPENTQSVHEPIEQTMQFDPQ